MDRENLLYTKKNCYENMSTEAVQALYDFSEGYKKFLDSSKTEREAVKTSIAIAEDAGFTEYKLGVPISAGDRLYYNNRGKNLFLFSIGSEPINNGIRISAAHIDSPRLDLKQVPLYEDSGMGFFKTHYYGGIRKYQWVTIPLAIHGVVVKEDGESVNISIGEDENDPIFYINDLLPHLGYDIGKKPLDTAIEGEKLNILVGSRPYGDGEDAIRYNIIKILNEKYGITETDLLTSELCAVPSQKARDVGFDRSMIASYGHDDRVCAYPALRALIESCDSEHTLMCILADKEEIGSEGTGGMQCEIMIDLINEFARSLGGDPAIIRANSKCLSADVSAAYDPNFPEVFEKRNTPLLNCGVVLTKFTGSRGKSGSNDADAEYIGWLRKIMAKNNVIWQAGELGKVDCGGGGTVAKYIAKHNIDTVDLGVPVLAMHAPYEVISKADMYETYKAICAFCKY